MVFDNAIVGGITSVGINYLKIFKKLGYTSDVYVVGKFDQLIINELSNHTKNIYIRKLPERICPEFSWKIAERYVFGKFVFPFIYIMLSFVVWFYKMFTKKRIYDITIAFSGHINDLTFVGDNFIKGKKKVAWLHGNQTGYYIITRGFAFLYKKIKNIVVLSDDDKEVCKKINNLFGINYKKIYNPIFDNVKKIDNKVVRELNNKYGEFILSVGRLSNDKDPETIIEAYKILREKYNISNKLVFVGDGPKKDWLIDYVSNCGLECYIFFVGSKMDVQNYYSAAKLFILSSPLEGLPTVVIEVMNFGVPVISSNSVPGAGEIIENGKNGLIYPVGDFEKLAFQCNYLLNNESKQSEFSSNGKLKIQEFDPSVIEVKLQEFINVLK